jgi:uncharacterized membrane protein YqaE (UPF0057 family)
MIMQIPWTKIMKSLQILFAILLPPVGVFMAFGMSSTLFINIGLTLLGWIPGIIHAVWAIVKQGENQEIRESAYENESAYK